MTTRRAIAWTLLTGAALSLLATLPARARAEDERERERPSAVKQLEAKEIEVLRRKIPHWDQLDPRKREHIARNVLRLRNLTPEQRQKLGERLGRLGEHKPDAGRGSRVLLMLVGHGVGELAWKDLPAETQQTVVKAKGRPRFVQMVIFQHLLGRIAQQEGAAAAGAALETFPERHRERVAKLQEQIRSGELDERGVRKARAVLGQLAVHGKVEALLREVVESEGVDRRAAARHVGETIRQTWSEAYAQTLKYVREHPEKIVEWAARQDRTGRPGFLQRHEWISLVWQLERAASTSWRGQRDVQRRADALIQSILVRELKLDAEAVKSLPARSEAKRRALALRGLLGGPVRSDGKPRRLPGRPGGHAENDGGK